MGSLFKQKREKKRMNVENMCDTIDNIHNKKITQFLDEKNNIDNYKNELELLQQKIQQYKPSKQLSDIELENKLKLIDQQKELEEKIMKIQENTESNNYLLNTSSMVYDYYDKNQEKKKSVIDLFNNKVEKNSSIDNYMNYIDSRNCKLYQYDDNKSIFLCKNCNNERIYEENNGNLICPICGTIEKILTEADKPSFKEPPKEISYFAYKRINHFNEWLAQFQAKESTDIPQNIYDKIQTELSKETFINYTTIKPIKIREILKKLGLNKYYEHVPHILYKLSGKPAPKINRDTEEKLRIMFKDIQNPWQKFCPENRSNFLSYSYVLYKCLQLLEKDEYLENFSLLKSREKLAEQDKLWKLICNDLRWEYIKTI